MCNRPQQWAFGWSMLQQLYRRDSSYSVDWRMSWRSYFARLRFTLSAGRLARPAVAARRRSVEVGRRWRPALDWVSAAAAASRDVHTSPIQSHLSTVNQHTAPASLCCLPACLFHTPYQQCSRIRILRFFSDFKKNMTFTFFWNDLSKKRKKSLAKK